MRLLLAVVFAIASLFVSGASCNRRVVADGPLAYSQLSAQIVANALADEEVIVKNYGTFKVNKKTNLTTEVLLNVPPRRMWGWGNGVDGYCGEASIQSVGLFWGNYISQEEVRYADGDEELLVAVNDEKAAKALKFVYTEWDYDQKTPQKTSFTSYLKSNLDKGLPIVTGWYEKQPSKNGDPDYDHIMPIVGYVASSSGTVSGFYHNDLYLQEISLTEGSALFQTRSQCSQTSSPKQPYTYCLPNDVDYALLISGNSQSGSELQRALLEVSRWDEPDWGAEDGLHEKPVAMTVKVHMSGLVNGTHYSILRFDDAKSLPTSNFAKGSWSFKYDFTATGSEVVFDELDTIMSDGTYFFRVVKA